MTDDADAGVGRRQVQGAWFHFRTSTVDEIVLDGAYQEFRFTALDTDHRTAPSVIVDVGAHIGAYTVLAARAHPAARVYALEPAASSFRLLVRNIETNGLTNVTAEQRALGRADTDAVLYHAAENWGHSLHRQLTDGDRVETVTCETLATFLDRHRLPAVDVMKMNIEGGEYDVLLHSPREVLRRVRRWAVEVHPMDGFTGSDIVARLRSCGFDVDVQWSDVEDGKGWVSAVLSD